MFQTVNPNTLTLELGGRWMRRYGVAPCPVCQPERRKDQNALTIAEQGGRLLLNCKKSGCDFRDLLGACGISPGGFEIDHTALERAKRERVEAENRSRNRAEVIWRQAQPIAGTLGETYLRARGIICDLSDRLRWSPNLYHQPSGRACSAMLAKVLSGAGEPVGIHRTYFTQRGERLDKVVGDNGPHKMMLGPCRGGAVRLIDAEGPLVVAEGIETALSLACGLLSGPASIWAALSTSGIAGLDLPPDPGKLTIAPDGDDAGKTAAHRLAERAHARGWAVSLLPAPNGRDWNDVLRKAGAK